MAHVAEWKKEEVKELKGIIARNEKISQRQSCNQNVQEKPY